MMMNEKLKIAIVCFIVFVISLSIFCVSLFYTRFNFYQTELRVDGVNVKETLHYNPNKDYHTLFRNFESPVTVSESLNYYLSEYVQIRNVVCNNGRAYFREIQGLCYSFENEKVDLNPISCLGYTEANEYGCGFGYELGFKTGEDYSISAEYILHPSTIFDISGGYYVKFVAYSSNNHGYLVKNKNLNIEGDVKYKNRYFVNNDVIIYIPYNGDITNKRVEKLDDFKYDNSFYLYILILILPTLFSFLIWYYFGKENIDVDMPESLSYYPSERKAWEVAAFFSPPFNKIDKNFHSSMMLDFYHRKVIDIEVEKKFLGSKLWVKIIKRDKTSLDEVENKFLSILEDIEKNAKNFDEGYFDIIKTSKSFFYRTELAKKFSDFQKEIGKIGKNYVSNAGLNLFTFLLFAFVFLYFFVFGNLMPIWFTFIFIFANVAMLMLSFGGLFTKHKGEYYKEYVHWQSFKKYLEAAPSIKSGDYKAVKLWDKYMVYALALGISDRAIEQLRNKGLIDDKECAVSVGVVHFSGSFANSTGTGSGGGVGGGGVGGGGGGGR